MMDGSGFVIRPVGVAQAAEVLDVYRRCADFLALGPKPASMTMVLEDLAHSREQGGEYCGIFVGEAMAGVVDFVRGGFEGDEGSAFLSLLMIAKEYRGKGLGRQVVKAVEEEIRKDRRVSVIRSGVQVNNPDSIAFWQRMGYSIDSPPRLMDDGTTVYDLLKELDKE